MSKNDSNSQKKDLTLVPDEETKDYLNFYCCKLSLNMAYAIIYSIDAIFLNIVNRLVFYKFHFNKYNFSFLLIQQVFSIIFFYIVSHKSKTFKNKAGEISFKDFKILKHYYISFSILFLVNQIVIFIGIQMIVNASMFQTLRKLALVKLYFVDLFFGNQKITCFISICVFLITIGSIISGIDTFSRDYLGIALTMVSNCINVAYNKFTESFKKRTKVSNLKLLVYNSYLSGPILLLLIFISGEFKTLFVYFIEKKYLIEDKSVQSLLGLIIIILLSCILVLILNSSFFMSNEKNSSMFTILLANTKDILICVLSRFILDGNKFTFNIVAGLVISTIGACMFSLKTICKNVTKGDKKQNKEEKEKKEKKDKKEKKEKKEKSEKNDDTIKTQVEGLNSSRISLDNSKKLSGLI